MSTKSHTQDVTHQLRFLSWGGVYHTRVSITAIGTRERNRKFETMLVYYRTLINRRAAMKQ